MAAVDLEISSASKTCRLLPSLPTQLTTNVNHVAAKSEPAVNWNGLHMPISIKSRLNLSIEVPSASQVKCHFLILTELKEARHVLHLIRRSFLAINYGMRVNWKTTGKGKEPGRSEAFF